ncbi:hypothetical protein M011DRAFT_473795 [Sporormia fimetaria CBS 119925]|uniref:Uncharacterized protein n=1 Tax=Sporormia fimetaria CBS 119925 TaxID=1340428 RepID=A0A6A6VL21_9PLEO|nr:hypothetical protein M011DRAFT_473795 [Sporormia fimetaria CBS 119925]
MERGYDRHLLDQINRLKKENEYLKETARLNREISKLRQDNEHLTKENARLTADNTRLKKENARVVAEQKLNIFEQVAADASPHRKRSRRNRTYDYGRYSVSYSSDDSTRPMRPVTPATKYASNLLAPLTLCPPQKAPAVSGAKNMEPGIKMVKDALAKLVKDDIVKAGKHDIVKVESSDRVKVEKSD